MQEAKFGDNPQDFYSAQIYADIKGNQWPANIYLFKVNIRSTRKRCEIYSKLIKTPERRQ